MAEIKDVKVWANPTKTDWRVYVHMIDGREGCKYLTGNNWNAKDSITGNMTDEEWKAARDLAVRDGKWHTTYTQPAPWKANRKYRCPDCGGNCGPNCEANRW